MKKIYIIFAILLAGCAAQKEYADNPKELYLAAEDLYNRGKYSKAIEQLDQLTLNHAGSQFADDAQILLGMAHFKDKNYSGAAAEFRRLLTSFPESDHIEKAQYMIAESYWEMSPRAELDQEMTETALDLYRDFLEYYPASEYSVDAQKGVDKCLNRLALKMYKSAELYYKMKDYDAAILYTEQLERDYPDSSPLPDALLIRANSLLKKEDTVKSLEVFQRIIETYPDSEAAKEAEEALNEV